MSPLSKYRGFLFSFAFTVVLFGFSEIFLQWVMPFPGLNQSGSQSLDIGEPPNQLWEQPNGERFVTYYPNDRGYERSHGNWEYVFSTNELGLRGERVDLSLDHRVLILGDSQVFGVGLNQHETISAQLQAILSKRLGQKVQVINGGVPGFTTREALYLLKAFGPKIKPSVVILFFFADNSLVPCMGNDLYGNSLPQRRAIANSEVSETHATRYPLFLQNLQLFHYLANAKREITGNTFSAQVRNYRHTPENQTQLNEAWDLTRSLVESVQRTSTQQLRSQFLSAYLPGPVSFDANDTSGEERFKTFQADSVGLMSVLKSKVSPELGTVYFDEGHLRPAAALAVANALADKIAQSQLLKPR